MKKQGKSFFNQRTNSSHRVGMRLRFTCVALCILMMLLSFVGCASYATSDETATLRSNFKEATEALDELKASSKKELSALKDANTALEEALNASAQKIAQLEQSISAAQSEIGSLKSSNQAAKQKIEDLKNDSAAAKQELESLKEQLEELQSGSDNKVKIYIDQGHNPASYHNSGASGNGLYEGDLTFTIGILLAELLEEDGRFDVCLSRPTAATVLGTDNNSSLDARVQGAEDFGADFFISLHTNQYEADTVNGIEVYVAEESGISYNFGNALLQGMITSTGLNNRDMRLGSELRVLKNTTMPGALLEMGFISNAQDASALSQHPDLFAEGIYNGIVSFLFPTIPDNS